MQTGFFLPNGNGADDVVADPGDIIAPGEVVLSSDTRQRFQNTGTLSLGPVVGSTEADLEALGLNEIFEQGVDGVGEFLGAIGVVRNGIEIAGIPGSLSFTSTSGVLSSIDQTPDPDIVVTSDYTAQDPVVFDLYMRDAVVSTNQNTLNLLQYDDNGVLTNIPAGNDGAVYAVFADPLNANTFAVVIPQGFSTTFNNALNVVDSVTFILPSAIASWSEVGRIVVRRDTDDFGNATVSRFINSSSAGGGGSSEHIADTRTLTGNVFIDPILVPVAVGQAFHFHSVAETTLTSSQQIFTNIDGQTETEDSPYTLAEGIQGYLTKDEDGQVTVNYTSGGAGDTRIFGFGNTDNTEIDAITSNTIAGGVRTVESNFLFDRRIISFFVNTDEDVVIPNPASPPFDGGFIQVLIQSVSANENAHTVTFGDQFVDGNGNPLGDVTIEADGALQLSFQTEVDVGNTGNITFREFTRPVGDATTTRPLLNLREQLDASRQNIPTNFADILTINVPENLPSGSLYEIEYSGNVTGNNSSMDHVGLTTRVTIDGVVLTGSLQTIEGVTEAASSRFRGLCYFKSEDITLTGGEVVVFQAEDVRPTASASPFDASLSTGAYLEVNEVAIGAVVNPELLEVGPEKDLILSGTGNGAISFDNGLTIAEIISTYESIEIGTYSPSNNSSATTTVRTSSLQQSINNGSTTHRVFLAAGQSPSAQENLSIDIQLVNSQVDLASGAIDALTASTLTTVFGVRKRLNVVNDDGIPVEQITREGTFDASVIGYTGVADAGGNTGQFTPNVTDVGTLNVSILDGTLTRLGTKGTYYFDMRFDRDEPFNLDMAALIPTGGRILSIGTTADNSSQEPYADISFSLEGDTEIRVDRANAINDDVNWRCEMTVEGFPEFEEFNIPSATPVVDQAASGFFDIGNMRQAWGVVTTAGSTVTMTFPAPFASPPTVLATTTQGGVILALTNTTTTTFTIQKNLHTGNAGSGGGTYLAIGLKP